MGLKKYEIITVGSDKRVRALRSWQVGDRYVNIGDVGGIVYDEKTLSQDGACWLFRGNFGFPGARIGGDSIVDVGEAALSTAGMPSVDILGSSVVVGPKVVFGSEQTAADAVVLTADDFEQGSINYSAGANWAAWKTGSASNVRLKAPIFIGGVAATLKLDAPGYTVQAYVLDRDGIGITATAATNTGAGVTLTVPAGQYFTLRLAKNPTANIVPADATAAAVTFTGAYETKLSVVDSRLEVGPANSTAVAIIRPGGTYTIASGAKYPESIIRNSNVSVNVSASADRAFRIMGQVIESTAFIDAIAGSATLSGIYSNIKNLRVLSVPLAQTDVSTYSVIQATDCNNFTVSPTIFPALSAAITANMPFIFRGCNVPNGMFYNHVQIANTYKNIDFALAQTDLGKSLEGGRMFVSSEVEGLYRLYNAGAGVMGSLVEEYKSVDKLKIENIKTSYNTTIYKDAYLNGPFDFAGTNVFGNKVRSHPLAQVLNVQPRAVNGIFNATSAGGKITGVVNSATLVCIPTAFRVNSSKGLTISNLPTGYEAVIFLADVNNVITRIQSTVAANTDLMAVGLTDSKAFIRFKKSDNTPITPADLAGVTVTVYNGCKIVNTGKTAIPMKGDVHVEDNATLVNASITGSGYFGGNCVASGLTVNGCAFMDNNAALVKTSEGGTVRRLYMRDNSRATISAVTVFGLLDLRDNAVFSPASYGVSEADIIMRDNATITGGLSANGVLKMEGNAAVPGGTVTIAGDITLCGSYSQTANKTWTGKRVIDSIDAPEYDNNVKTKYDF